MMKRDLLVNVLITEPDNSTCLTMNQHRCSSITVLSHLMWFKAVEHDPDVSPVQCPVSKTLLVAY
jgi:hypothetical protein